MSEHHLSFVSALGAFKFSHLAAASQKGRSFKARKVHAEGQVDGGRRASSLLLSGEETVVGSPGIKRP